MNDSIPELLEQLTTRARAAGALGDVSSEALRYATPEQQNNRELVHAAIQRDSSALKYASPGLRDDKDIVTTAVQRSCYSLQFASPRLRNDRDIALAGIQTDQAYGIGNILEYGGPDIRDDKDIVLAVVQKDGSALQYASPRLQDDKAVVMAAVQHPFRALEFASQRLRNDPDVVLAAVKANGYALRFASKELQNDPDVVLAAVKTNGQALQFANSRFWHDPDIALTAIQNNFQALKYVDVKLLQNPEFVDAALLLLQIPDEHRDRHFSRFESRDPNFESRQQLISVALETRSGLKKRVEALEKEAKINNRLVPPPDLSVQIQSVESRVQSLSDRLSLYEGKLQLNPDPPVSTPSSINTLSTRRPTADKFEALRVGKSLYERYLQEHRETLVLGRWITILDNDYSTARDFETPEQALEYYRGHPIRYCQQYKGPTEYPERIFPVAEAIFGPTRPYNPLLAYVEARLSNPEEPGYNEEVKMMVDTGATICMGRHRLLNDDLGIEPVYTGQSIVGGNAILETVYVLLHLSLKIRRTDDYMAPKLVAMGYFDPPPANEQPEDMLLGQNFLRFCRHRWNGLQNVEIEYP